ncbi:MAG: hypothetical protein AAGI45_21305 [Cyanobacteria bacterium P01_H01_bin.26]
MPKALITQAAQSYIFVDYFKLNFAPPDILAYFDVFFQRRALKLPHYSGPLERLHDLKVRIKESLPIEYPIAVSHQPEVLSCLSSAFSAAIA